jgi:probable rRNA maturation factor
LSLSIRAPTAKEHIPFLRRHLRAAHALLHPPLRELSLALVGRRRMMALHAQYLHIPSATDVLTFELDHDRRGQVIAGEVVVCTSVARAKAEYRDHSERVEMLLYAVHGMLHLCGYNDVTRRGSAEMHSMEDKILSRLGLGRAFDSRVKPDVADGADRWA